MIPIPIPSAAITVRSLRTRLVVGRSIPIAMNSAFRPFAITKPKARPSSAPSTPTSNASSTTEVRIWPREAPSVRNMPNSVVRCATVIEKVLKMRKAPTKRATKAKTSSAVRRKPRLSRILSEDRLAFSSAVSTRAEGGIASATRCLSTSGETPGSAATEIWSKRPTLPVRRCATGSVTWAMLAPPKEASPNLVRPTRRNVVARCTEASSILSPIPIPASSAADWSIDASVGPRGRWPSR